MSKVYDYEIKSGKRWGVNAYLGIDERTGRQVNFNKRGFLTKKEAQQAYTRAQHEFLENKYLTKDKSITFQEVYEEWIEQHKNNVKYRTVVSIQTAITPSLEKIGSVKVDKITPYDLQKLVNDLRKQYKARNYVTYLFKVLNYAYRMGYTDVKLRDKVILPPRSSGRKNKKKFYTRDELNEFLKLVKEQCGMKWYVLFHVLSYTGMRVGEYMALSWKDINLEDKKIDIRKTIACDEKGNAFASSPKNNSSFRVISIDEQTVELLKKWKVQQAKDLFKLGYNALDGDQLVISKTDNGLHKSTNSVASKMKYLCKKNNFPYITVHGLRHTHCSLLLHAGVPAKSVQHRLGHSTIKTTMDIYAHVMQDSVEEAPVTFSDYMNG